MADKPKEQQQEPPRFKAPNGMDYSAEAARAAQNELRQVHGSAMNWIFGSVSMADITNDEGVFDNDRANAVVNAAFLLGAKIHDKANEYLNSALEHHEAGVLDKESGLRKRGSLFIPPASSFKDFLRPDQQDFLTGQG